MIADRNAIQGNKIDPHWEPGRRFVVAAYAKEGLLIEMTKRTRDDDSKARIGLRVSSDRDENSTPTRAELLKTAQARVEALSEAWRKQFSRDPVKPIKKDDIEFKQAQYNYGFDIEIGATDNVTLRGMFIDTLNAVLTPPEQKSTGTGTRAKPLRPSLDSSWTEGLKRGETGLASGVGNH